MSNKVVCVIQHAENEPMGRVQGALMLEGLQPQTIAVYKSEPIPQSMQGCAGLVLLGGPMGVYEQDRYGFLKLEIDLVRQAIQAEVPVLGICLGSQLLAASLGAKVLKAPRKEIGWTPIALNDEASRDRLWTGVPRSFHAFSWHGDEFELPVGAVPLASSEQTEIQAFRYGSNAYGLLFHLEVTQGEIESMAAAEPEEEGKIVEGCRGYLANVHYVGASVFQRWAHTCRV